MPNQEQPTVALLVPTELLERVWNARRTRNPKETRSGVCDAALAFLGALLADGVIPANLTLPNFARKGQHMTEVYVRAGYLLNVCDMLGTADAALALHTALVHARNSLEEHDHLKPLIHRL